MLLPRQQQRVISYHKVSCLSIFFWIFYSFQIVWAISTIFLAVKKRLEGFPIFKRVYTLKTTYWISSVFLPKPSWLSPRPISDSQLHMLPCFHLCPIYLVVFKGSYYLRMGYLILRGASRLDAFSVYPVPTWLLGHGFDTQPMHQRSVHPGPLVLRTAPLKLSLIHICRTHSAARPPSPKLRKDQRIFHSGCSNFYGQNHAVPAPPGFPLPDVIHQCSG